VLRLDEFTIVDTQVGRESCIVVCEVLGKAEKEVGRSAFTQLPLRFTMCTQLKRSVFKAPK